MTTKPERRADATDPAGPSSRPDQPHRLPSRTRRSFGSRVRGALADTTPLRTSPAFRRLFWAGTVTTIGAQMTVVAVPVQLYNITHSSTYVGLTGAFGLVPLLVFGLWGGAIADAVDRRTMLLCTSTGIGLVSVTLWLTAALGVRNVWLILILFALQQALLAMNQPARSALLPRLLPPAELPSANALNMMVQQFGTIVGPTLGGALIPVVGLNTLYLIDAGALVATIWATWRLPKLPPLPGEDGLRRTAGLREVLAGFRYVATQKILLMSFLVDVIAMAFGMPRALFPEMAQRTFGDPPGGGHALGLLYASIGIGAVLGGVFSGWLPRVRRQGVAVIVAIVIWGLGVTAFGVLHSLWLAVACLAVGGAADQVSSVFRNTMLQVVAPDEMRGRMQGVFFVVVVGGPRIADIWHGPAAAHLGTGVTATGGGLAVVLGVVLAALIFPAFWRYRAPARA